MRGGRLPYSKWFQLPGCRLTSPSFHFNNQSNKRAASLQPLTSRKMPNIYCQQCWVCCPLNLSCHPVGLFPSLARWVSSPKRVQTCCRIRTNWVSHPKVQQPLHPVALQRFLPQWGSSRFSFSCSSCQKSHGISMIFDWCRSCFRPSDKPMHGL